MPLPAAIPTADYLKPASHAGGSPVFVIFMLPHNPALRTLPSGARDMTDHTSFRKLEQSVRGCSDWYFWHMCATQQQEDRLQVLATPVSIVPHVSSAPLQAHVQKALFSLPAWRLPLIKRSPCSRFESLHTARGNQCVAACFLQQQRWINELLAAVCACGPLTPTQHSHLPVTAGHGAGAQHARMLRRAA